MGSRAGIHVLSRSLHVRCSLLLVEDHFPLRQRVAGSVDEPVRGRSIPSTPAERRSGRIHRLDQGAAEGSPHLWRHYDTG